MTATESIVRVGNVWRRIIGTDCERCPYCPRILEYEDAAGLVPKKCECVGLHPRFSLNVYGKSRPFASRYLRGCRMKEYE